jgi:hypothetical protein
MAMASAPRPGGTGTGLGDDSSEHSAVRTKAKGTSRGRARELLRQAAIDLRCRSSRAGKLPFPRLVATIEEHRLNIDRFRWIDENRPIRELGA